MEYILLPLAAWCAAGFSKVLLYGLRYGRLKPMEFFRYGGFPSAHTALIVAPVFYAGLTEGFFTPLFSIGFAVILIVITDAHGLRRYVGHQASVVNELQRQSDSEAVTVLKEHIGHTWWQIVGGTAVGIASALFTWLLKIS